MRKIHRLGNHYLPQPFQLEQEDPCRVEVPMQSFIADLRHSARELRKRPGFTSTAVLSLALGIGATTAVFSAIYAVLINPFPYPDANRMMEIHLLDSQGNDRVTGYTGPEIAALHSVKSFESVVPFQYGHLTTTDGDLPEDVRALSISPDSPSHWRIPAMLGRWLIPSDAPPGQEPALSLSSPTASRSGDRSVCLG